MKKKLIFLFSAMALLLGACGDSAEHASRTMKVDGGEIILGEYKGLKADKVICKVSDGDVDATIESELEEYVEYDVVERKAEVGDYVAFNIKSTSDGEVIEDYTGDDYGAHIGRGDFDDEFERNLVGVTAGEQKKFAISYEADYPEEVLAGNKVDYEIEVTGVEEVKYPELTDEFVQEKFDCNTVKELRESTRQRLEFENEENAKYSMQNDLIQQLIDTSVFQKYSDELYEQYKKGLEEEYLGYADWFGCDTVEEVYDSFGMTEEDVEKEILNQVYTRMVVDAIAEKEKIKISDKEYRTTLAEYVDSMEYEDDKSLLEDFGEDEVRFWMIQEKVIEFIVDQAQITEIETEQFQEDELE